MTPFPSSLQLGGFVLERCCGNRLVHSAQQSRLLEQFDRVAAGGGGVDRGRELLAGSRHILLLDPHEGEVEAHVELEGKPHEARLQLLRRKFDVPSSEVACGDQVAYGRLVDEELGVQRALLNSSVGLERQVEEPIVSSTRLAYRCLHGNIT